MVFRNTTWKELKLFIQNVDTSKHSTLKTQLQKLWLFCQNLIGNILLLSYAIL